MVLHDIEQFLKNDVFFIFCDNFVSPISNLVAWNIAFSRRLECVIQENISSILRIVLNEKLALLNHSVMITFKMEIC